MEAIKKCDEFLAKHHHYVSPLVLAIAAMVTLDLVMPTILLAQEVPSGSMPTVISAPSSSQGQQPMPSQNQGSGYQQMPERDSGQYQAMPPQGANQFQNQPPQNQYNEQRDNEPRGPQFGGGMGPQNDEQALKGMLRGMKGAETAVKSLQKQFAKLEKQNIAIPENMKQAMEKMNEIFSKVKEAKTMDEALDAGVTDIQEYMQTIQDGRMQLEQLSRWPQTVKQADKLVKKLDSMLVADKKIADRLSKKDFDISDIISNFESKVQALKASREKANELIKTDPEAAFDELQTNFFEQIDEVMQSDRTIKELSNLSRFSSSFKTGLSSMQTAIKSLKAKKVDTTDLETKLQEMKDKATEITNLMKEKPIDTDAVVNAFDELNSLREDFETTKHDLIGDDNEVMPWDQGPSQINMNQMNAGNIMKYVPQQ